MFEEQSLTLSQAPSPYRSQFLLFAAETHLAQIPLLLTIVIVMLCYVMLVAMVLIIIIM